MKATGMVRKVDDFGRVVVPIEICRCLGISIGDPVEVCVEGDCVVIKKYDAFGSVEQLLDNLERSIVINCELLTPAQSGAILGKMEEMKAIIKGG